MGEEKAQGEVPRRLRRFYRNGQAPPAQQGQLAEGASDSEKAMNAKEDLKQKSAEIAKRELQSFRERFKRLPKKEEFDDVAEKIYTQVKKDSEGTAHGRFRHSTVSQQAGQTEEAKEQAKPAASGSAQEAKKPEEKKPSVQELFSNESFNLSGAAEEGGGFSLDDLNLESEGLKKDLDGIPDSDQSENFLKEIDGSGARQCPNCKAQAGHLIFCPNCGLAFCAHCAKQAKDLGDKLGYECPKCNTEFKAKKT